MKGDRRKKERERRWSKEEKKEVEIKKKKEVKEEATKYIYKKREVRKRK